MIPSNSMKPVPYFRRASLLTLSVLFLSSFVSAQSWKAGAASTVITPDEPMWMAGYGGRDTPAVGKRTELYAKALVLEDASGNRGVILTMDLVGISRDFSLALTKEIEEKPVGRLGRKRYPSAWI
jgi:hypothetical protein